MAAEVRYFAYGRLWLIMASVLAAGVAMAFTSTVSEARATAQQFQAYVQKAGINEVLDALDAPLEVRTVGQATFVNNAIRYDYEQLGASVAALSPGGAVATVLDVTTFIVIPLMFAMFGGHLATYDRRNRTKALRASRDSWGRVVVAKLLALMAVGVAAVLALTAMALIASQVVADPLSEVTSGLAVELQAPTSQSPLLVKATATAAIAMFFGVIGYAIGAYTGSSSWPFVILALLLFTLPITVPWDPRNLIGVLADGIYDFWGQFELVTPLPVAPSTAVLGLLAYFGLALVIVWRTSRRDISLG